MSKEQWSGGERTWILRYILLYLCFPGFSCYSCEIHFEWKIGLLFWRSRSHWLLLQSIFIHWNYLCFQKDNFFVICEIYCPSVIVYHGQLESTRASLLLQHPLFFFFFFLRDCSLERCRIWTWAYDEVSNSCSAYDEVSNFFAYCLYFCPSID